MNRRDLLKQVAGVSGLMVVGSLLPSVATSAPGTPEVLKSLISSNHGHVLNLTLVDFVKNGAKVYSIKGSSLHNHDIEVSLEAIQALLKNKVIEIESSAGMFHTHTVRLQIV